MPKKRKPLHARVRKPMPRKPPKVEVPKTAYRRRPKHPRAGGSASEIVREIAREIE
jgi:hypothetical protein